MNVSRESAGLFPSLLGDAFDSLPASVKAVHRGTSGRWQGTASVRRSKSRAGRWLADLLLMPAALEGGPVDVQIEVAGNRERWTRRFGDGRPLRSTLFAARGLLVERMGLTSFAFRLVPTQAGVEWQLQRVWLPGIRLPRRLFSIVARCETCAAGYRFVVSVGISGIGDLIGYEGTLHVRQLQGLQDPTSCA